MASIVQEVTENPRYLLEISQDELKAQVHNENKEEQDVFTKIFNDRAWRREHFSDEENVKLCMRLYSLITVDMFTDNPKIIFELMRVSPEEFSKQNRTLFEQMYNTNPELMSAMARDALKKEGAKNITDTKVRLAVLIIALLSEEKFPEKLSRENLPLKTSFRNETLLSAVFKKGTDEQIQEVLSLYRDQLGDGESVEYILQSADGFISENIYSNQEGVVRYLKLLADLKARGININPTMEVLNYNEIFLYIENFDLLKLLITLSPKAAIKEALERHIIKVVLLFARSGTGTGLKKVLSKFKRWNVNTESLNSPTSVHGMTHLQKFLLMVGNRRAAKILAQSSGTTQVRIPRNDRLYKNYDHEKKRDVFIEQWEVLKQRVIGVDKSIWDDKIFIKDYHKVMRAAFKDSIFIFRDAWEKSNHDPIVMGTILSEQKKDAPVYHFFYQNFINMYYFARCRVIGESEKTFLNPEQEPKDENNFFDPKKRQYRWRMMYEMCCFLKVYFGDMPNLDSRYSSWLSGDSAPKIKQGTTRRLRYPDTRPT